MSKRWQYKVIEIEVHVFGKSMTERALAELNRMGSQGWELSGVAGSEHRWRLFLKKEF